MDPVAALVSLVCGHMVEDHAEALTGWLASGGFRPSCYLPVDISDFTAACVAKEVSPLQPGETITIMAMNGRVWAARSLGNECHCLGTFHSFVAAGDSEY